MAAAVSSEEETDTAQQGAALALLTPEDRALVDRLRAGDESTFLSIVEKNHRAMVRVAMGYVSSEGVAEEVVQEAWVGILQGLHKFEGRCPLRAWMFRILINCAKMRGAREARSVPFSALESESSEGECRPVESFRPPGRSALAGTLGPGPRALGGRAAGRCRGADTDQGGDREASAEPAAGDHLERHRGLGFGRGV